ncbi:MAG TPA: hypothetical protein PKC29_15305 [Thermodesulfobacteriota bacterium]|nr:hypothetical protein [Thermodesulfobacteriota bacterium]
MNRLILASLPLLMLALAAGAEASIRTDGFTRAAPEISKADAGGAVELCQQEETYGDDNYYNDQGYEDEYSDEYTDEYGNAVPGDQPVEDGYAEDEYADDEGYEDEYTDEQGYQEEEEYDVTQDDNYYDKDPRSLVQPGDTFDPFLPPPNQ